MKSKIIAIAFVSAYCMCIAQAQAQTQIVLSSRWFHPRDSKDTLSTMKIVNDFKVERIDWMYCDNPAQLNQLKQKGIQYSLTIHPQVADSAGYTTPGLRIKDINGKPLTAPWMKTWKIKDPYWGCVNNPAFKALFIADTKKIVDLGAYGVVVDDARFNDQGFDWGGCYCDYCVAGFNAYLQAHNVSVPANFNYKKALLSQSFPSGTNPAKLHQLYKSYQTQSVVTFLKDWRSQISSYAKRPFTFLTNNAGGKWNDIYNVFDVGIAEMPQKKTSYTLVDQIIANANANGKKQIFSFAGDNDSQNAAFYLYCYLSGAEAIVPWDVFMNGNSNAASVRHFISRQSMLPALNFVSDNKALLKTAQRVSPSSLGISSIPGNITICRKLGNGTTYLFSSPDFQGEKRKTNVSINRTATNSAPLANRLMNQVQSSTAGSKTNLSGDYILMKL